MSSLTATRFTEFVSRVHNQYGIRLACSREQDAAIEALSQRFDVPLADMAFEYGWSIDDLQCVIPTPDKKIVANITDDGSVSFL